MGRKCSECNKEKEGSWCYFCKKNTSNNFFIKVSPGIFKVRHCLIKMIHKRLGVKKFLSKVYVGWQETKGPDSAKYPEGVYVRRMMDREHNKYEEIIISDEDGKVIRNVSEPLRQHIPNRQKRDSKNQ